jgi:membrane protease YdiL (CAAX protease family)
LATPPGAGHDAETRSAASSPSGRPFSSAGLTEPLVTFFVVTGLCSALYWIGRAVPVVGANLHAAIAFLFLAAPALAARMSRRPFDYEAAGLRLDPIGRGLRVLGAVAALTWPLFFAGFLLYYGVVCGAIARPAFASFVDWMTPQCVHWHGWSGARLTWPPDVALTALDQLLVVAVPEELFFRGYLQGRLEERFPPRRTLFGAAVGPASIISSALFAVGHVLVDLNPMRLAVFVPGLVFSWMRSRTGAIAAGALYHALCNVYSDVVHRSFF